MRCASILNTAYHTWATSFSLQKLALLMHTLTGVAMVHNRFANYRDVLLYALSLVWDVTLDFDVQLQDTLVAAAFGLAQLPHAKAAHTPKAGITTHGDDFDEDNEDEVVELPYDETSWSLPPWFAEAWSRSRDPDGVGSDLRKVLENLPLMNEISRRPQDNNHNNDAKRLIDRTCKTWQQKLLHAFRILGNLSLADNDEGSYEGLLHLFHLLAELEQSMSDFRKTQSVRDSVVHSNQLFGKQELAAANLASRINALVRVGEKERERTNTKVSKANIFVIPRESLMEVTEVTVATAPTEVEDVEVPTPPILTQLNPGPLAPNDSPMEVPLYAKLRRRLAWWRLHATPEVVEIITHGLPALWIAPPPRPNFPYHRHTPEELPDALTVMSEYLQVQAVHRFHAPNGIHYVPWFMVYKPKPRFISSCVDINARLRPPPYFRLPNRKKIFPYLVQGHFALKVDLKHAYFHLALCPELQKYFNFQIGHEVFQCDSACFGLHYIPYYWTQLMKTFSRKWRALGIVCFIYLDDIIILGPTRKYLLKIRPLVLRDLEAAGVTINFPKSILDPTQEFEALGFEVNLRCGTLNVPQHKKKG